MFLLACNNNRLILIGQITNELSWEMTPYLYVLSLIYVLDIIVKFSIYSHDMKGN